jgi:CubicO group peptidase (beta-lactamase class C family)
MLFCAVGIGLAVLFAPAVLAQSPTGDWRRAVDAHVTAQMQQLGIPGAAVGIVRGDQVEYVQGYGIAGDDGRPVTPQTPFYLASLSKSFTAAAVMQLVEAGKLELDAPVQRYLPWFRLADAEASAQITVRHLLAQTSGFSEVGGYERDLNTSLADDALEQSIRALHDVHLNAAPGAQYEYSNTNYDLLGLLVATVSGESYESYVQRHIFDPLAMEHAYTSLADARRHGVASGYYPYFGQVRSQDAAMFFGRATTPSAGLVASAEDLTHWLIAHLNQGQYAGAQLVSPAGMELLHTPVVSITDDIGYAMGWVTFPFTDALPADATDTTPPLALTHSGRWVGYATQLLLVPEQGVGVVTLLNLSDDSVDSALSNIGWNVGLLALGLPPKQLPVHEDWLAQNTRLILYIIIAFFAVLNLWLLRPRSRLSVVLAACLVQVGFTAYIFLVRVPDARTTMPLTLHFAPDLGQMTLVLVLLAGWSVARAVVAVAQQGLRKDEGPVIAG